KPETHCIWLPSSLSAEDCLWVCVEELTVIEEKLRTAQCYNSLESLRYILHIKDQSCAIIEQIHQRGKGAAQKYQVSREAKLKLSGHSNWEKTLNPQAPAPSNISGQPNLPFNPDDPTAEPMRERTAHDGSGETRKVLSWIWLMQLEETIDVNADPDKFSDPAKDTILCAEWAKSHTHMMRAIEEVELLKEEMRWILTFLDWKHGWWISVSQLRTREKALLEGLKAYTLSRSNLQKMLSTQFRNKWMSSL
ncbi:hypothetical protein BJ165DRAFT_1332509, partial [Panaeolus papilionaceus]